MKTKVYKNFYNQWVGETEVELDDSRVLRIVTSKSSRGSLNTTATVSTHKDGFLSHMVYVDYCKTVESTTHKRITEKVVSEQHNKVISDKLDGITNEVIEFYQELVEA